LRKACRQRVGGFSILSEKEVDYMGQVALDTSTKSSGLDKKPKPYKMTIDLLMGPILFLAVLMILPESIFSFAARGALATMTWMIAWWITRPIHLGVTSLLPILLNAAFGFIPMGDVLTNYASEVVILLLGANIITVSWSASGLDNRIALRALCLIGPSVKQQIVVWFTIAVVLSIFLPNTIVCAVLVPVAISMLRFIGEDDVSKSEIATVLLLAIAWGAGLGGFGSPLGGAMNLVSISYIEELTGNEYMYIDWVVRMMPMLIIISLINIAYLFSMKLNRKELNGSKEFFVNEYKKLEKANTAQKWGMWLFVLATVFAFARPMYSGILPGFKPAFAFLLFGFLAFIVPGNNGERLLTWKYTSPRLMWGLFYLFAGGMAVGKLLTGSGAATAIAGLISSMSLTGGILTIAIFAVLGVFLCNVSSDTAATAIAIPIVITVAQSLKLNPIAYIYITSVACNCAYILPTSVRAIPVGYGLDPRELLKRGMVLIFLSLAAVTVFGYLFLKFWPGYSIA
jgi:sodium-dependent dicarboxylate transporter 2/3/5